MRRWPAFEGLRAVQNGNGDLVACFARCVTPRARRRRFIRCAQKCRRSASSSSILRCARTPSSRRGWPQPANENTGIFHDHNEPGSRGGFSLYVPEYYTPDRTWPLVMALHGGSGNGRGFLWSWLRDARSLGAILIAPTATGNIRLGH